MGIGRFSGLIASEHREPPVSIALGNRFTVWELDAYQRLRSDGRRSVRRSNRADAASALSGLRVIRSKPPDGQSTSQRRNSAATTAAVSLNSRGRSAFLEGVE